MDWRFASFGVLWYGRGVEGCYLVFMVGGVDVEFDGVVESVCVM